MMEFLKERHDEPSEIVSFSESKSSLALPRQSVPMHTVNVHRGMKLEGNKYAKLPRVWAASETSAPSSAPASVRTKLRGEFNIRIMAGQQE